MAFGGLVALVVLCIASLAGVSAAPRSDDCGQIDRAVIAGKPPVLVTQVLDEPQISLQMATNILPDVPAFSWSYGCAPTSAAMLFGYYDRTGYDNMYVGPANDGLCPLDNSIWGEGIGGSMGGCPLSATHMGLDGRTTRGHVDNYWVSYGSQAKDPYITYQWTEHAHSDCTGDFMGTSQYEFGNIDGATYFYYRLDGDPLYDHIPDDGERDGCHGLRLFAESRGYAVLDNFTQLIKGEGTNPTKGFTFEDFQNEIDCGRPVLIHLENHTMLGYGYASGSSTLYIHDTWDHEVHTMTWGGTYDGAEHWGVTVIRLSGVVTEEASDLSAYSATLNGCLVDLGGASSIGVSFEYGTTFGNYTHTTSTQVSSSAGEFSYELSGLSGVTTYYFRARAFDGSSYTYGVEKSLTTTALPPEVATDNATLIYTDSARLNGTLTSLGTATNVEVYFEWGVESGAYSSNTTAVTMTGGGAFSFYLSGLTPGTLYYFRSVAHGHEIALGDEVTFTTLTLPPLVLTLDASDVTTHSGILNGDLISLGTASSVEMCFEWGLSPGLYTETTVPQASGITQSFSTSVTGLPSGTTCYFRIRAVGHGTSYGIERSFTTGTIPPHVSTVGASEIGTHSASLDGFLLSPGTAAEIAVSFQYGTVPETYWFETPPQVMANSGDWSILLDRLKPGTTYYFRAKAVGHGTVFGPEMVFTTSVLPPILSDSVATDIGAHSVVLRADLRDLGTAEMVEVSFEYGTAPDSWTVETPSQARTSAGLVSFDLVGLSAGTTYHFRARAIGHGTIYGAEGSFTMLTVPPTIATADPSSVGPYSVDLKGYVISLGSATFVDVIFEWCTTSGAQYANETFVSTASELGEVTARLSGLVPGTTYYFRTKAAGHGTGYGDEKSFTTSTIPPMLGPTKASRLTTDSVVLTGELINLGTASSVVISVEWAAAPEGPYFDTFESLTTNALGAFSLEIDNLEPEKTYYFRVKADGHSHGLAYGDRVNLSNTGGAFNWLLLGSAMAGAFLIMLPAMLIARVVTGRRRAQWR